MSDSSGSEKWGHPQWEVFSKYFQSLLMVQHSCFARDVLRNKKNILWEEWKRLDAQYMATGEWDCDGYTNEPKKVKDSHD